MPIIALRIDCRDVIARGYVVGDTETSDVAKNNRYIRSCY